MNNFWTWFWVVFGVAALVGAFFVIRRRRYLGRLRALGWSHDSRPALPAVADLHAPPFALGLSRSVDELVAGVTPGGLPFRVFEYDYRGAGPAFSGRVACVQLPFCLPPAFVSDVEHTRLGIATPWTELVQVDAGPLRAIAPHPALAGALLSALGAGAGALSQAAGRVDLGVDGNQLVAVGAPKDPDELRAFLAVLDPLAQAVSGPGLRSHEVPPLPARIDFYGHPDWQFGAPDLTLLEWYPVTTGGFGHEVTDPVTGLRDGIRMDAFTHEWKTHRIETYSDGQGRTQTRTVTDSHSEPVCGFLLPFDLPGLSVNGRRLGGKVAFESDDFNDVFKVRAVDPKFASDAIHPRTMEWLLATRPRGWSVSGRVVVFEVERHDLMIVEECEATLRGWLGRIPRFVWADLGLPTPPFLVE